MKSFIVHISDASDLDERTAVTVNDGMDVGRAAQIALDDLVEKFKDNIEFPIFIDIHPNASFGAVEWMHKEADAPVSDASTTPLKDVMRFI